MQSKSRAAVLETCSCSTRGCPWARPRGTGPPGRVLCCSGSPGMYVHVLKLFAEYVSAAACNQLLHGHVHVYTCRQCVRDTVIALHACARRPSVVRGSTGQNSRTVLAGVRRGGWSGAELKTILCKRQRAPVEGDRERGGHLRHPDRGPQVPPDRLHTAGAPSEESATRDGSTRPQELPPISLLQHAEAARCRASAATWPAKRASTAAAARRPLLPHVRPGRPPQPEVRL